MKATVRIIVFMALVVAAPSAWAHRYIPNSGIHTTAAKAIPLGDIDISQVIYHTVTPDSDRLWLSFEAAEGVQAKIQIGVPYIKRLEGYRPAFALLGEGLPEIELPFAIPDNYGGILFSTDAIDRPDIFDEEFTGTESWIFDMQTYTLPRTGLYYIVGFVPSGESGKFWIAPGTREFFGFKDIMSLPWVIYKVRTFHEIFPFGGLLAWGMLVIATLGIVLLI